jgi:fibronectin type 3 domain-containing protein/subtilisin-like proprotein convertase family protein
MLLGLVLPALPASAQEGVHYAYWDKGKGKLPAGARVIEDYGGFVWISSHEAPRAGEVVVRPLILFDGETIDPQASPSMSADDLSALPQTNDAFLLQLAGPVKTGSWQEAIESTGLRIVNYVPDFTFLVWGTPQQVAAALRLTTSFGVPLVAHVERETSQQRLEPELRDFLLGGSLPEWTAKAAGGALRVRIFSYSEPPCEELGNYLRLADPQAKLETDGPFQYYLATLAPEDIDYLVKMTPEVRHVEMEKPKTLHNNIAARTTVCNVETEWTAGWTGTGVIVDHNDSGVDTGHADFPSTAIQATSGPMGTSSSDNTHGTHTAGSVLGRGLASSSPTNSTLCGTESSPGALSTVRGMAYGAKLATNNIFDSGGISGDAAMMQWGVQQGAVVSTNSWGYTTRTGGPDTTYDSHAIAMDTAVRDADSGTAGNQQLAICFSAGNSGPNSSTVGSPGLGKNVLTVGASENDRCGSWVPSYQAGPNINTVASFSSRGPSQGRIKPDVCTPGTDVLSVQSRQATSSGLSWDQSWTGSNYALDAGTSMACPLTAGMLADFFQFYKTTFGSTPSPALGKAAMINGAVDMLGSYPNNNQGWGRTNLRNTIEGPTGGTVKFLDQTDTTPVGTGGQYSTTFGVTASTVPLKITLAWTDPPGAASCSSCLINNLDLDVADPSGTHYHGNQFTGSWSNTNASWDTANNVENVFIQSPATGCWTITVKGTSVPTIPPGVTGGQDFAIVYSGAVGACSVCTAPGAPTLNSAVGDCNGVNLAWTAGSGSTAAYNVYRYTGACGGGTYVKLGGMPVTGTSYSDTTAVAGTSYAYVVRGTCDAGGTTESANSNCLTGTRTAVPAAPAGVTAAGSCTDVSVSWTASAGATSYNVLRGTACGTALNTFTNVTSPYSDTTAVAGTTYQYWVVAVNACGTSANSACATGTRTAVPAAPAAPTFTAVSCTTLTVNWTAVPGATSYDVYRKAGANCAGAVKINGAPVVATSYDDTGLTATTQYSYNIVATNACGSSANGTCASVTTTGVPAAPTGVTAAGSCTGVSVSWTASTGSTSYNVLRGTTCGTVEATFTGVTSPYNDTSAVAGTTYNYWVVGVNSCGTSVNSSCATGTRTAVPAAPAGVTAAGSCTDVSVSWTASAGATSYNVLRGTACGTALNTFTNVTSPYSDTTAVAGTTYQYWVVAVNACGTSANSACATGTRLASPTPTITGASSNVCPSVTVALSTEAGMSNYQWYANAAPISGANLSTYTASATGNYTVSYTAANGCSGTSAAHSVTISPCVPNLVYRAGSFSFSQIEGDALAARMSPGEKWALSFKVDNTGSADAVSASLAATANNGLGNGDFCTNPVPIGNVPAGGTSNLLTVRFVVPAGWAGACPSDIQFGFVSKVHNGGQPAGPDEAPGSASVGEVKQQVGIPGGTVTNTYTGTGGAIPDNNLTTYFTNAVSPADASPVTTATVYLTVTHPRISDINTYGFARLRLPDNTTISMPALTSGVEASLDITTQYNANGPGSYQIEVADGKTAQTGSVTAWRIVVSTTAPSDCGAKGTATCAVGEVAPGDVLATAQTWSDAQTQTWPSNPDATSYTLYRGVQADLPNLLNNNTDSCTVHTGSDTFYTVSDDPTQAAGGFYWYLVTGTNGAGEGTAGNATAGARIVNSNGTCP